MKNITKMFVGTFAALALVLTMSASASAAVMATEIYTPASGYLKVGSGMGAKAYQMPNVIAAQTALNACTPGLNLALDGKFGPLTKAKFVTFQASKAIMMDGVIGPVTAGQLAACSGSVTTPTNPSTPSVSGLNGTDGTISDVDELASYNNEEVGEGQEDVKVAGFEVEASTDGDIALKSIKVQFDSTGNTGSTHLDDYISGVSIWMGSTKIGSADAEDFSETSDIYTKTITLSNAVIDADETEKFYISVDAANAFDSSDLSGDSWDVDVLSIRFQDGSGVVTTDDSTGDLPGMDVGMDFVSFGDAADTELKISKDSSSPEDGIVIVDESSETEDVVLLKGKLRLEGDSDVTIDAIPVTFTVSGDILSDIASSVILVLDGEEYSESSATTAGGLTSTITFDNLDFDLSAGDSVNYEIRADINGTDDFGEGETLLASITSDNRSAIDVENEEGDQVGDSDKTGTAIGEAQEFRSEGIAVTLSSVESDTNADGTLGTYTITFKVAAVGDDAYVGTATSKYTYAFSEASRGATTSGFSAAISNNGGNSNSISTTTGGNWKIQGGTSIELELQVFGNGATLSAGAYRAALSAIGWDSSDADAALDNSYTSNMDNFKTPYEQII